MTTLNFTRIGRKVERVHFFFRDEGNLALPEPTPAVDLALRDEILEASLEGLMAAPFAGLPYTFLIDEPGTGSQMDVQSGMHIELRVGVTQHDPDLQTFTLLAANIRRSAIFTTQIIVRETTKSLMAYSGAA